MGSPLFLLTSTILAIIGIIIPFFTPIFLFSTGHAHWAWISIAASIISTLINAYISKFLFFLPVITKITASANIVALAYHTLLLFTAIALAPSDIWWILVLAVWEIARQPLQDVMKFASKNAMRMPVFDIFNPIICAKTSIYSGYQIYITGYASIISALVLLLK